MFSYMYASYLLKFNIKACFIASLAAISICKFVYLYSAVCYVDCLFIVLKRATW